MRKIIAGAGMAFIFCIQLIGQTPVKLLSVHLSQGEEVLQVAAQRDGYAALTVFWKDNPGQKRYYILTGDQRRGPYNEVIDLQAAFDTVGFIYAARNDTTWYVYEGSRKYGPYSIVSKVRSGNQKHRCLYLARRKMRYNQVLYDRAEVIGGSDVVSECFDYELSADGSSYALCFSGLMADYFLVKDDEQLGNYGDVKKIRLSDDGRDVGFLFERNILDLFLKNQTRKDQNYSGLLRYKQPGSFGEMTFTDTLDFYMTPGDIAFARVNYDPVYYYSYQDRNGVWKLFKNGFDMKVKEREITLLKALSNGNVIYSAKPGEPGPNGLDTAQFYIYIAQQPVGGPYLEVRQILPSPGGSTMAVEARIEDGWSLILPNGGLGPFGDMQDAAFMGEGILGFKAIYKGEWTSMLVTSAGMGVGSLIRERGQAVGIANYSQGNVQILVQ